ncbi:MAG: STAS domain-containing protein [Muribaculaceae bacterium]|nr:STAS domain-containing protein [Muribaculaceae bacterium]
MTTIINEHDGKMTVEMSGQLDTLAATQAEKDLQPAFQSDCKDVIMNCNNLEYVASAGLRLFLALLKAVKARGGQVTITGMNDDIMNVFKVTGFSTLFKFE